MPIANLGNIKLNYLEINHQISDRQVVQNQEESENIVMIHGLATNLAFWYPVANQLILKSNEKPINTRIILFDLPGHGRSSMPISGYNCTNIAYQLNQLVDFLKLDNFHLIAHSFGGSVAIDFLNQFPQKIKSLTLVDVRLKNLQPQQILKNWQNGQNLQQQLQKLDINLSPDEPEAGLKILTEIAKWQVNQKENKNHREKADLKLKDLTNFGLIKQDIKTAKKWLKLIQETKGMKEFCQSESIKKKELKEINTPIFLIYGSQSPNLQTKIELEKLGNFNNSYIVEDAGHFFPLSKANILVEQIINFLHKTIEHDA